jgi:zeaxanthin glucosyltransferase
LKIGLISLPLSGHLNPFLAVARALKARGHHPVYFGVLDCAPVAQAADIDFLPYGQDEFPLGAVSKTWGPVAKMHGMEIAEYHLDKINVKLLSAALKSLPQAIERSGVEALVVDPIYFLIELIPLSLHLPFVHLCPVLQLDTTLTTPPSVFSWPFEMTPEARERNLQGLQQLGGYIASAGPIAAAYAAETGLVIDLLDPDATASPLAFITQCPREFDFPGVPWPPTFHYAGSLVDNAGRAPIPFDWTRLDGRPLIYASLGTLVNGLLSIYKTILAAAARMPGYQVVFSIGHNVDAADLGPIPENVILVAAAPQIELLKHAVLCITHAGLNTTLESLAAGVPMVAIPIGYDQPGTAARITYHGVGEFLEVEDLSADALFQLLDRVLSTPSYREKASHFREALARTNGPKIAADVIEQAFLPPA